LRSDNRRGLGDLGVVGAKFGRPLSRKSCQEKINVSGGDRLAVGKPRRRVELEVT